MSVKILTIKNYDLFEALKAAGRNWWVDTGATPDGGKRRRELAERVTRIITGWNRDNPSEIISGVIDFPFHNIEKGVVRSIDLCMKEGNKPDGTYFHRGEYRVFSKKNTDYFGRTNNNDNK